MEVVTVESRAKLLGHALHPMLIVFPLGLLATAVIFDLIYLLTNRSSLATAASYMIAAGLIGGVIAGVFGLIDWRGVPPGTRAKRVGAWHGVTNLLVLALFAVSWFLRLGGTGWEPSILALVFSFAGAAVALFGAWLGGELVERLAVGVDREAGLDAPNSLRHSSAHQRTARPAGGRASG